MFIAQVHIGYVLGYVHKRIKKGDFDSDKALLHTTFYKFTFKILLFGCEDLENTKIIPKFSFFHVFVREVNLDCCYSVGNLD